MKKVIVCIVLPLLIIFSTNVTAEETEELSVPEIVDMAKDNSFLIQQSNENQRASEMAIKSTKADFFPKALAQYSYTALKDTPYRVYQDSFMAANKVPPIEALTAEDTLVSWNVSLVQPLFTGFALTTKHKMATLEAAIKVQEKRQTMLDVKRTAETACYKLLLAQKMFAVTREAAKSYAAHLQDAKKFYDQGLIPFNDLLKFEVALADAVQQMEQANAGVVVAKSRVNLLLNRGMDTSLTVRDISNPGESSLQPISGYIETAMAERPVLKIVDLGILNLSQAITLTKSTYYPQLSLIGRYEQKGDNVFATHNSFDNDHNASITLNATWTLFEWRKTGADAAKLDYQRRGLVAQLQDIKNSVTLEIKHNYENLAVSAKNIKTAEKALTQARENLRITELQYRQQVASSTELLDARTFLTRADTNYYKAVYGYMINQASLDRAVGR